MWSFSLFSNVLPLCLFYTTRCRCVFRYGLSFFLTSFSAPPISINKHSIRAWRFPKSASSPPARRQAHWTAVVHTHKAKRLHSSKVLILFTIHKYKKFTLLAKKIHIICSQHHFEFFLPLLPFLKYASAKNKLAKRNRHFMVPPIRCLSSLYRSTFPRQLLSFAM